MVLKFIKKRSKKLGLPPGTMVYVGEKKVDNAIEQGKKLVGAGADIIVMCSDYCFQQGPFLAPKMFRECIGPYLHRQISAFRKEGAYTIKHTDGNIMPILDDLVSCEPHAVHSLDPMAGVDMAEVKKRVGRKVCLMGNVSCALLQTGSEEEVFEDAQRSIREGMSGGGYIFSSSNSIFRGVPLKNYFAMLEARKRFGKTVSGFPAGG